MQDKSTQKKRSRKAKLLGGAMVGVVLSLGAVGGSASAWNRPTSTIASTGAQGTPGGSNAMMSSGIRW